MKLGSSPELEQYLRLFDGTRCPDCSKYTVKYDSYFKRKRCTMRDCPWIESFKSGDHKCETEK